MDKLDFNIESLGNAKINSPMKNVQFINENAKVLFEPRLEIIKEKIAQGIEPEAFNIAGPREKIYFDPSKLRTGIVTCGGLCPGINDVIRAIVFSLYHHYGVRNIFGFQYGYEGLIPEFQHPVIELDPDFVEDLHEKGGTVLHSSRGPQNVVDMVDTLERMNIGILFTIGGDGTLRGARDIAEEVKKRGLKISVIGIPKTIDNDISFVQQSFGFETAISEAKTAIYGAHVEANGAKRGIGLVKLMGRHSGFIAANATLATSDVNFCLIPEVPFKMENLLKALEERFKRKNHAVIVVGEGAGQDLFDDNRQFDKSGNLIFHDIGTYLKNQINDYFNEKGEPVNIKYIDPSYIIRSVPANAHDSVLCLLLGHNAAHAGMAGYTNVLVGSWNRRYILVPIPAAVSKRKKINPEGSLWNSVLASTGQPVL
ncbi:MAG: ATP-dependent 6-phosphofructokinase [Candidatus Marinimicrobia bacterium]|nr:ATP-dependent 6-phosphofructokinase [Candidatus Neomarinimicrobiota bacterium]